MLIIGIINSFLIKSEPHIKGSGIPEIEGQLMGELDFKWWSILWKKFIAGILSIGSGLFLGREGPSIQLGGSIGQGVAELLKSKPSEKRILIASGAAAGLATAFNAPMAGTLFVLEEIYHNFSPLVWISALSSSLVASFISENIFGMTPVLNIRHSLNFPLKYYWILLLLGITLGILGYFYQRLTLKMPTIYNKLLKNIPNHFYGFIPLLLVLPIGYFVPNLLGGGNNLILNLSTIKITIITSLLYLIIRFVFSIISYGSGLPGGIFLPILTLGSVIGATFALVFSKLGLLPIHLIANIVIFSMAGYFSGIGKAPFSAIILITEMVGNLSHLMPLAFVSLVAFITVDILGGAPIYESLLKKMMLNQSINVPCGKSDQLEFTIFENSYFVNKKISQINWPDNSLISNLRRGEQDIIPNGETVIHAGDAIIILVDKNRRNQIYSQLQKIAKKKLTN